MDPAHGGYTQGCGRTLRLTPGRFLGSCFPCKAAARCGAVSTPIWDPSDRIEGAIATLIEQIPADRRRGELEAWFDGETDLTNMLAIFEVGRRTDQQQQALAGNELLDEMVDAMITELEAMPAKQARETPDIGRIMWLAAEAAARPARPAARCAC